MDLCDILWADKISKLPVDPNCGKNGEQDEKSVLQSPVGENNCWRTTWVEIPDIVGATSSPEWVSAKKTNSTHCASCILDSNFWAQSQDLTHNHGESAHLTLLGKENFPPSPCSSFGRSNNLNGIRQEKIKFNFIPMQNLQKRERFQEQAKWGIYVILN